MAVLGVKIDNLTEKITDTNREHDKLWAAHLHLHTDQETRMRRLEACTQGATPLNERVADIEKWQEGEKVRNGKLAAIQTLIAAGFAGLSGWISSRNG